MMTFNQLLDYDSTILEGVVLPDNRLDSDTLKSQIVIECGNLAPMYDEPQTMKDIITQWFKTHAWNITRICNLIEIEYAPLENYDRMYNDDLQNTKTYNNTVNTDDILTKGTEETTTHNVNVSTNDTETHNTSETLNHGLNTLHQVSAYDTSTFSNDNQTVNSGSDVTTLTGSDSTQGNQLTSGTVNKALSGNDHRNIKTNTTGNDTDNNINTGRAHGNIGVTTSQQMFLQESDLLAGFNVYEWIVKCFRNDNFLYIW